MADFDNFGGHSVGGTPLPIPNREVKPDSADGTRGASPRESRTPPNSSGGPRERPSFCFLPRLRWVQLGPPDPPLCDELVELRPWLERDVPAIVAACNDPETARWTTVPSPYSEDDARA